MGYNEEIVASFGAKTTGFEQGLQKMRQGTASLGDDTQKSFLKASNGAREFKKLLAELTEQSPILGIALKAAFSPIGAALTGSLLLFKFAKQAIDDLNKQTDALEAGTATPINNMKDALRDAQKSLADFDRAWQTFQHSQNKTAGEKLTQNLAEQLSLLDKQVGAAEKLSKADAQRLQHQKLLVTHGLQGRALFALNAQKTAAQTELDAANSAERALLGKTTLSSAQGLIGADEQFVAKKQEQLKGMPALEDSALLNAITFMDRPQLERKRAERRQVEEEIKAAQKRIEENKETVLREHEARKNAAARTAEARSRFAGASGLFDSMSMSIEGTRQAIVTSGGWGAGASPLQNLANSTAAWQSNYNAWAKSHGMPDMFQGVSSAKAMADPVSKNIEDLNTMFAQIIDSNGMKVNFTIEDK